MYDVIQTFKPDIVLYGADGHRKGPGTEGILESAYGPDSRLHEAGDRCRDEASADEPVRHSAETSWQRSYCPEPQAAAGDGAPGRYAEEEPDYSKKANVIAHKVDIVPNECMVEIMEVIKKVTDKVDIQDAKILISGGRGMAGPENFKICTTWRR